MNWHLIHTKPRQEQIALTNLQQQGYECYLPVRRYEAQASSGLVIMAEPLFPRYLFIRIGSGNQAKGWGPVRSTRGVSRLVCFGNEPAKADDKLVDALRLCDGRIQSLPAFSHGDRVVVDYGPLNGLEALYQTHEGEKRAMILIEMLSRPTIVRIDRQHLRKIG